MSKSIRFTFLLATSLCWAAPAEADIYPALQHWLDGLTDRTHKWQDCPKDATQATAGNPYFKFNPSTDDPKFSRRQLGPYVHPSASWTGTESWYYQHARFLRVKPCLTYCKVEAVRICTPAFVGKPQPMGPFGDGTGKNGCEMIWTEETEAQPPK
jgi:hypothetical protein